MPLDKLCIVFIFFALQYGGILRSGIEDAYQFKMSHREIRQYDKTRSLWYRILLPYSHMKYCGAPPAYAAIPGAAGTQLGCDHRYAGLSLHLSPNSFYHSFRLFFHWRLFCSTIYPIIVLFYLHEQLAKRPERLELQQVKTAIKSPLTAIKSTLAGAFVQSSTAKTHYHMTQK